MNELAEALFQSIGMQLSVEKYQAIDVGRGANLDELDVPLNNRVWLKSRFAELRKLDDDAAKLRGIDEILHWTDPGPGGFYDDLGNPSRQPHLVREGNYRNGSRLPGNADHRIPLRSLLATLVVHSRRWPVRDACHDALPRTSIRMRATGCASSMRAITLTSKSGSSRSRRRRTRGQARLKSIHFNRSRSRSRQSSLKSPREATSSGELTLTWQSNPERGGPGRGCQIAEVWLIKVEEN